MNQPAAFLDRDGVINVDTGYLYQPKDLVFAPGAISGLQRLQQAGFLLIVVTNQSGIARGYYTPDQFAQFTNFMFHELLKEQVNITATYHCPHHPDGQDKAFTKVCNCRKPQPGLIFQALKNHDIDLNRSVLFGDKNSDILAAKNAGINTAVLIGGGQSAQADHHATTLDEGARYVSSRFLYT